MCTSIAVVNELMSRCQITADLRKLSTTCDFGEFLTQVLRDKLSVASHNLQELRSFLAWYNYYGHFVANLSSVLHPLHHLLSGLLSVRKHLKQPRSDFCQLKFSQTMILSSHYGWPEMLLLMISELSFHIMMPDGTERPIAIASRTLNASKKKYSHIEKEALSLKRFHNYL